MGSAPGGARGAGGEQGSGAEVVRWYGPKRIGAQFLCGHSSASQLRGPRNLLPSQGRDQCLTADVDGSKGRFDVSQD